MIKSLFRWRSAALAVVVAATTAAPAHAATPPPADTSGCTQTSFSQPFASFGDDGYYTLMPGQAADDFAGTGWTLNGGASLVTATLDDGTSGQVLSLPSGASAVSPLMCVTSLYPTARAMIRDVTGSAGVDFAVAYEGTRTWLEPKNTGHLHGRQREWTLSNPFNLQPYHTDGWQVVQFRLTADGQKSDVDLYNVYVDPHMKI